MRNLEGQKLFTKKSVFDSHLTGKRHVRAEEMYKTRSNIADLELEKMKAKKIEELSNSKKTRLFLELLARKYIEALAQERADTIAAVERKQTLTLDEYNNRAVI
jgi:splicing factor 3A subunit 3